MRFAAATFARTAARSSVTLAFPLSSSEKAARRRVFVLGAKLLANYLLEKDAYRAQEAARVLRLGQRIEHDLDVIASPDTAPDR